ncbi:MAG: I78 family peptidase inhibitor [Thermomonas sp.]
MSMRLLILPVVLAAAALLVSACTTMSAAPPVAGSCNADAVQAYTGQIATTGVIDAARKAAGAEMVRTLKPGQVVTMEYLEGRLNLHVDGNNAIVRGACG